MSFTFLNQLPSPAEIKRDFPLSEELKQLKKERDAMISDVITGKMTVFSLSSDLVPQTGRTLSVIMSAASQNPGGCCRPSDHHSACLYK